MIFKRAIIKDKILKELYEDSCLYDSEYSEQQGDIDFWVNIINLFNVKTLLELGCGTGRVGVKLMPHLKRYFGLDISASFLIAFKKKISNRSFDCDIKLAKKDMRKFTLQRTFDMVIIPFNVLSHLYNLDDLMSTFFYVKKALGYRGLFAFDIFNPSLELLSRNAEVEYKCGEFIMQSDGKKVVVYEKNCYDKSTQVNHIIRRYTFDSGRNEKIIKLPMRVFYPCEIDNLLRFGGFKITKKYGDYNRSAFESKSRKQIFICS